MQDYYEERMRELIEEVEGYTQSGYKFDDLENEGCRASIKGMLWTIMELETADANLQPGFADEDTIIGKIKLEVAKEVYEHYRRNLVIGVVEMLVSCLDEEHAEE